MTKKVLIYLCDLTHVQNHLGSGVPLNIGYIASVLLAHFSNKLEIKLFKFPDKLEESLNIETPNIVFLSNYMWNKNLSLAYAKFIKGISSEILTIMGGPNIRVDLEDVRSFLETNPQVDGYILKEGETPAYLLIKEILKTETIEKNELHKAAGSIEGVLLNIEGYVFKKVSSDNYITSFDYPSPYLSGILDEFIRDDRLIPIFEGNRGCPYSCTFCAWGISNFTKIKQKDFDVIISEYNYVVKNGGKQSFWSFTDSNFGMFERDVDISLELSKISKKYGYPKVLSLNWAKTSIKNIRKIIDNFQGLMPPQIAVQSFDKDVLKDMKRKNLRDEEIINLLNFFKDMNVKRSTDILVGSGVETLESHYKTLKKALELEYDTINIGTIYLLPGTEMESKKYREKYNLETSFRLLPRDYGTYRNKFIFEYEETIRGSKNFPVEALDNLKITHFLLYFLWNMAFGKELLLFGKSRGINPLDIILEIQKEKNIFIDLLIELRDNSIKDFFDTEQDIFQYFEEEKNVKNLYSQNAHKQLWKYMGILLSSEEIMSNLMNSLVRKLANALKLNSNISKILVDIYLTRVNQDFRDNRKINRRYQINKKDFDLLKEEKLIPESSIYKNNYFEIIFSYEESKFFMVKNLLEKYNYSIDKGNAFAHIIVRIPLDSYIKNIEGV